MPRRITRRDFLRSSGLVALAAACGTGDGGGATPAPGVSPGASPTGTAAPQAAPEEVFTEPTTALSGSLSILLWSHFVPSHDDWFDDWAEAWGREVGVDVTVDHLAVADVPARIASEIQAGRGHDLVQYIANLSQHEPAVVDLTDVVEEAENRHGTLLDLCRRSSFNPNTDKFYAYAPAWVPDPGDYRRSLWEQVGLPDGPSTWDDLLEGGARIKDEQGVQLGIGMSQEIDSNMAGRALLWSYGAFIQDADENVTINSAETVAAVEYMKELFERAMTPEVFSWNAASNNEGLNAGTLSYILNSISAYRSAQDTRPDIADDVFFVPALTGPGGQLAAQHVMYNWLVPEHASNVDAAKEFLLHYTANLPAVTWHSKLYDFPAFDIVPELDGWLDEDPFGSQPADKLAVLKDSIDWSTNIGHPGPASPAIGQVFAEFIIPDMFARAARGDVTPQQAVDDAERQITAIFDEWRGRGLVGGGA